MVALEQIVTAAMTADEEQKQTALAILNGTMPLDGSEPELTLNQLADRIGLHRRTIEKYDPPRHLRPSGWKYYESEVTAHILEKKKARAA